MYKRNLFRRLMMVVLASMLGPALALAQSAPDTGLFLNIIPPGQNGYINAGQALQFLNDGTLPAHFDDQRLMYSDLLRSGPGLSDAELLTYFKPEFLGAADAGVPDFLQPSIPGVTITRDAFGVPHIKGRGRRKLFIGVGYASAADRLFAMDLIRHSGRGRVSELVGADQFNLSQDTAMYDFAGYDEADLQQQLDDTVARFHGRGRRLQRDLQAYVDGINLFVNFVNVNLLNRGPAEYIGLGISQIEPFTVTDVLAVAVQLEFLFGAGGGSEHSNARLLQELTTAIGEADGTALFKDLRMREEVDAPVTTDLSFPYPAPGPIDPAAVATPDLGSVVEIATLQVTGPLPPLLAEASLSFPLPKRNSAHPAMSNFVAVTAANAVGGHPIAVMGPQTGYFLPQLLIELSLDGGGLKARGVAPLGSPFVVLGRGRNYAWSATAGGSDTVDVRAELLCEPGGGVPSIMSMHYMFNGECLPIFERIDTWCAGDPLNDPSFCDINGHNVTATVRRTQHGIVFARATVGGQPVALVRQRASFFREGDNAAAFMRVDRKTRTPRSFERAMQFAPGSFNWVYVNQDDLFYFHSGLMPVRAPGVDPEMPSWGTGEWEWQGFISRKQHPSDLNPAKGWMTSWNNKPATDWNAADSNYSFGPVQRVDSLSERVDAAVSAGPVGVGQLVEIMEDAGTVDLRGSQVLPAALQLIGAEPTLAPVLTILNDWVVSGAFRRDRDGDGEYDHSSAVAIMDEWFQPMIHSVFDGQLLPFYSLIHMGFDNRPGPSGSAYQSGYYGYLQKAFQMALGQNVADPFEVLRCADGSAAGCRAALVSSLNAAVAALTATFGSADPALWRADPSVDQIEFSPFGLATVDPMPWVNRPTFQQVVQVTSKRPQ